MGFERSLIRRLLISLTLILLVAVSAGIGVLIANGPACWRYLTSGR